MGSHPVRFRSSISSGRATMLRGALVAALAIVAAVAAGPDATAEGTQAALAERGSTVFQFVGKISQNGALSDDYGYLSEVAGLDEASLYAGGDPLGRDVATARFLYFSSAELKARSVNGNVFITQGTATTTVYYSETPAGATFDDPSTFKQGAVVAVYEGTWQDIVNVQAPNQGVEIGRAHV